MKENYEQMREEIKDQWMWRSGEGIEIFRGTFLEIDPKRRWGEVYTEYENEHLHIVYSHSVHKMYTPFPSSPHIFEDWFYIYNDDDHHY